ncbi:hypothetical protein [Alicyclobacillus fodiniaquatilis]|jgi:hypothetical protein|uniref:CDP-alcohol phosphatidyltransferase family protein n=1 Tax=Alicyclobacillus fodiniaquatilis TaxID=1661150 RepID=A0ABW4JHM8_9BACL
MSGAWPDILRAFVALLFAGAAVKLMDDALDVEYDLCRGKRTLAVRLERACLPYSLAIFGIAMITEAHVALAVFLGSYAVGMFTRLDERLPSRVPAFVEIIVAIALCIVLVGWREALWGVAMMSVIDWLDDMVDRQKDLISGQFNVAIRFGFVEVLFAILIALCLAVYTEVVWTALGFIALVVLSIIFDVTTKKIIGPDDEEMMDKW